MKLILSLHGLIWTIHPLNCKYTQRHHCTDCQNNLLPVKFHFFTEIFFLGPNAAEIRNVHITCPRFPICTREHSTYKHGLQAQSTGDQPLAYLQSFTCKIPTQPSSTLSNCVETDKDSNVSSISNCWLLLSHSPFVPKTLASRDSRPSWQSLRTAMAVTGLLMLATRRPVDAFILRPAPATPYPESQTKHILNLHPAYNPVLYLHHNTKHTPEPSSCIQPSPTPASQYKTNSWTFILHTTQSNTCITIQNISLNLHPA